MQNRHSINICRTDEWIPKEKGIAIPMLPQNSPECFFSLYLMVTLGLARCLVPKLVSNSVQDGAAREVCINLKTLQLMTILIQNEQPPTTTF